MAQISVPQAQLIGVFLESLAYGLYLMVFIQCMAVLRKRHSRPSDYLVGTAVSLFILITVHLLIDILRNMEAFTSNEGVPDFPVTYYSTWDTWKNIVKIILYVAVTLVSDAFILYRSFIVWRRNYLITIFPFLLFISDIAVGIYWVYTLSVITSGEDVFIDTLSVRATTFYSITLTMNIICTSLIAIKILIIQKAVKSKSFSKENNNQISRLVPIIVESGSVYSALLVVLIATDTSALPAMFVVLNTMSPIIGIVFSSVIVRVGLGLSRGDSHEDNRVTPFKCHSHASGMHTMSSPQTYIPSFPDGGAQISLQQTIHTHINSIPDDVESNISNAPGDKSSFGNAVWHQ